MDSSENIAKLSVIKLVLNKIETGSKKKLG